MFVSGMWYGSNIETPRGLRIWEGFELPPGMLENLAREYFQMAS